MLLHLDDPDGRLPWLDWSSWLAANGEPGLKPAGTLRFRLYDQLIQAAVGGQGVALGRLPLIEAQLRAGQLPLWGRAQQSAAPGRAPAGPLLTQPGTPAAPRAQPGGGDRLQRR